MTNRMTNIVSVTGIRTDIQYGKNNHIEYKWSNVQQERILQLSYQLVRTSSREIMLQLGEKFKISFEEGSKDDQKILLKLLAHTRDIEAGKGEYTLSYILLKELMIINKRLFVEIMKNFVGYKNDNTVTPPYGSWKDIKYYCNEIKSCPTELVEMVNDQINIDIEQMKRNELCSLVAKWIPRETNRKFGWINVILAKHYFQKTYGKNGWSLSAIKKAQTHYRQIVSGLNKYIDTIQIKQCGHEWSKINFEKVTSITMMKQRLAFLNRNESNQKTNQNFYNTHSKDDRIQCRQNLLNYIEEVKTGSKEMKGRHICMIDFVKAALRVCTNDEFKKCDENDIKAEKSIINEAWRNNSKTINKLDNIIAMIDTSGCMEVDNMQPLYTAMGLGIRVAEKSTLGKRILTFDNKPSWVNLDDCPDFVSSVQKLNAVRSGLNTNFHITMDLILDTLVENNIQAEEVEELVLAIFSTMQFDAIESSETLLPGTVRQILEKKYYDAGVKICGKGYKLPHILYWNLKSTNGFPDLSYQDNITMLSGYSPLLLNAFVNNGVYGIKNITPWVMLTNMLNKNRYNQLEKLIE